MKTFLSKKLCLSYNTLCKCFQTINLNKNLLKKIFYNCIVSLAEVSANCGPRGIFLLITYLFKNFIKTFFEVKS